jgi:hypothetical protein
LGKTDLGGSGLMGIIWCMFGFFLIFLGEFFDCFVVFLTRLCHYASCFLNLVFLGFRKWKRVYF